VSEELEVRRTTVTDEAAIRVLKQLGATGDWMRGVAGRGGRFELVVVACREGDADKLAQSMFARAHTRPETIEQKLVVAASDGSLVRMTVRRPRSEETYEVKGIVHAVSLGYSEDDEDTREVLLHVGRAMEWAYRIRDVLAVEVLER
jgi:hypothetical protein